MDEFYTERNRAILDEIGLNVRLRRGREVRSTNQFLGYEYTTRFSALGSYHSNVLGGLLHLGLKYGEYINGDRVAIDLSIIRAIAERCPSLSEELPIFVGYLVDANGSKGEITEDFSQGGQLTVKEVGLSEMMEYDPEEIPVQIRERLNPHLDDFELARACFLVGGRRRIGDMHALAFGLIGDQREQIFPLYDLLLDPSKVTLRLNYVLD